MKKYALPLLLVGYLLTFSSVSFAEEEQSYGSENQSYGSRVGDKALNGFANMTTAFLEIPKSIINITNESNVALGILGGGALGALNTIARCITGLTDLITAPLLTKPIVHPAYVWDDFDVKTTYGEVFRLKDGGSEQSALRKPGNTSTMKY